MIIDPSLNPAARVTPLGEKVTTGSFAPIHVRSCLPVDVSHKEIDLSPAPVARIFPVGEKATLCKLAVDCVNQICSRVSMRYKYSPIELAIAKVVAPGDKATPLIWPLPKRAIAPSGTGPK